MTKTDISPEAVRAMLKRIGSTPFPDGFQGIADDAEAMIYSQAARIAELEDESSATISERNRATKACEQIHNNALRELRSKWIVRDLTQEDFALIEK